MVFRLAVRFVQCVSIRHFVPFYLIPFFVAAAAAMVWEFGLYLGSFLVIYFCHYSKLLLLLHFSEVEVEVEVVSDLPY